jgi:hypothetical protein
MRPTEFTPARAQTLGRRQRGMTFIGLLCLLALAGIVGYAGLRLAPLYLNYMKVARAMESTATEVKGDYPDPAALRGALAKHWEIDDITGVSANDIEIRKEEHGVSLHVAYDDSSPYIANVSLSVHFDKTVKVE